MNDGDSAQANGAISSKEQHERLSLPEFRSLFDGAVALLEKDASEEKAEALDILQRLQMERRRLDLFSLASDALDDIATPYLPYLALEYHLAVAYLNQSDGRAAKRKQNLDRATELFLAFLRNLDTVINRSDGCGSEAQRSYNESGIAKDFQRLLDVLDSLDDGTDEDNRISPSRRGALQVESREEKIARFRRKRDIESKIEVLTQQSKRENQKRQNDSEDDSEIKLNDLSRGESLRDLYLQKLLLHAMSALDESFSIPKELEMVQMALEFETRQRGHPDSGNTHHQPAHQMGPNGLVPSSSTSTRPPPGKMSVTRIDQDPSTGKLSIKREELRSQVFQPGWNLPTMTLQEFGEREMAAAMARSEQQKAMEERERLNPSPKRYDQLVKAGLEDNNDLVDASAALDREWDKFKEENPRGSGNKMGDRGDRNI